MKRFTIEANGYGVNYIYDNLKGCRTAHFMTGSSVSEIQSYIDMLEIKYKIK